MNHQDALFPIVKDDITFDALLTQAKTVIEQQSGQCWSNTSENDPGITLLEACCYGASDLGADGKLTLRGNYCLYLLPGQETQADNKLAQERLNNFLKNNRNLGEPVSKIIWLQPINFLLQIDIELNDNVIDIPDIFAQVYIAAEQMVLEKPVRYTTQAMKDLGYSNEKIFSGPYLHHGWIPTLSQAKNYTGATVLNLSHLVNRLLAINGIQSVTRLALADHDKTITPLPDDNWSWEIAQGYYPRLWGNDPLALPINAGKTMMRL